MHITALGNIREKKKKRWLMGLTFVMERSHGLHCREGGLGLNPKNQGKRIKKQKRWSWALHL